ncbi:MAG: hypothetical protein A2655_01000 [Candidatus Yanofskybacteria bacterium RIFCSPHIGHO2_01_FULL_43_42]|uniref:Bacterial surface antigen (D15) domain-containing protein n=1 Tax=Candidatus Yanofskybacteria bacterium RIFCSPLOWO2_01_FULL_43_22 TaxID=1802695 RepID=A0A1F8GFC6_9BACT|nr:MAG: hypothetical protein A2655_01000 [Candidatus Yanofskybacteria bacterium RIFCSPHIGHO2_01_FULL_43_42]OGN12388.1 MAG: hypothetical protein A3D48_01730 [Candidatus Yanofskybacteria bacterium RIFCSPHIGHO2_02_FULL_43_17]OGN23760.1 MAG: hypothetical protein A3A13_01790 [Candidatus Yanofskybacteria bacterium RIFCSPLOWO2_01_FULL_43_22]
MKIKGVFVVLLVSCLLPLVSSNAEAQFGKNNVRYGQLDQFYESYRFDIWHNLDTSDPVQKEYLEMVIANLENARDWMGGQKIYGHTIEKRIPILLCDTHSCMESLNLVGGFLPEGVGAFVEVERKRMALKADFSKPLSRAIGVHELAHEFQHNIWNPSLTEIQRMKITGERPRPLWFFEGGAEFIAGLYEPHTRDDIRGVDQRIISSDRHFIPTWEALMNERVPSYLMTMVFDFLKTEFSNEEEGFDAGVAFQVQGFKQIRVGLGELLYDLTKGELGNPDVNSEKFDQAITKFWMDKYGDEVNNGPKPNEGNDNFDGRLVMPWDHSAPMSSPVLSPDGTQLAAFTVLKYGVSLVRYEIPKEKVYIPKEEREKLGNGSKAFSSNGSGKLVNLTSQLPPMPWEYLISQGFETWPFNGFDASWSPDGKKIAFFARISRDHALVLIDTETGKVLRKIELPLDQAFSPSFSSDGNWVYFSAAENVARDIWAIYVGDPNTVQIQRITNNKNFATAPVVSPDGTKVVYIDQDGDFQHLFLHYLGEGRQEQLTFGEFNDGWPSWSDDGSTIVYASDEAGGIWNLYTLDLTMRTVRQWTEFPLGLKTPVFAKGTTDTVYYVSPGDDTQSGGVYDKVFEAKLKKPIREYAVRDTGPVEGYVFNPLRDLFKFELDENQLLNPKEPPERWKCGGGNISLGVSTYWGMFGQSYFGCSNLLETKQHVAQFASYGSFKIFDYSYQNQEKQTSWRWGAHRYQMPYYYQFYDVVNRYPAQLILNNTWITESALDLYTEYPQNKFNRLELFSRLRNRSFSLFGYDVKDLNEDMFTVDSGFTDQDVQMYRFLRNSAGSNFVFGAAYVRDTVIYSNNTWGPFHGNALRTQVEFAPPMGKEFQGFVSASVAARTYRHLGSSSLFAGRAEFMTTSRANGDFMLLCGPDRLRGCEYGSIAGNQVGYASGELRFPIPGTYVLGIPVRGFLFADAALARFNDEIFPAQKLKKYGFGAQYIIPIIGLPAQSVWTRDNGKWNPSFYVTLHW